VPLAEWSGKAAIEYEQYIRLPFEIGKAYRLSLKIFQSEIRGEGVQSDLGHRVPLIRRLTLLIPVSAQVASGKPLPPG
jgi:hypothetical protein